MCIAIRSGGVCQPYSDMQLLQESICDNVFEAGVDLVYIPHGRFDSLAQLRDAMEDLTAVLTFISGRCQRVAEIVICTHFYSPCGHENATQIPTYICPEACYYISDDLCRSEWEQANSLLPLSYGETFTLPNCSNTDEHLKFLNLSSDCCTNGNIMLPGG